VTHEQLDHMESAMLGLLALAKLAGPLAYAKTRRDAERDWAKIDQDRMRLIQKAKNNSLG
jgi:hypothetical protein